MEAGPRWGGRQFVAVDAAGEWVATLTVRLEAEGAPAFGGGVIARDRGMLLADWIEDKVETHRGRGENGYKALEMIHAIYESARCHEKVIMPMRTRLNPLDIMVESGHLAPERPGRYDIRAFLLRGERMSSDEEGAQVEELL